MAARRPRNKPKTALAAAKPLLRKTTQTVNREINSQKSGSGMRPVQCK